MNLFRNSALFAALSSQVTVLTESGALKKYALVSLLLLAAWFVLFALFRLVRQCLQEAAGAAHLSKDRFFWFSLLDCVVYTAVHLPKIALYAILLFALNALFTLGADVQRVFGAQKRVRELTAVVKNLSRMDDIARVTVLDDNLRTGRGALAKRYKIDMLSLDGSVLSSQIVAMEGEELFIDSVNINFDYAEIGGGSVQNIAWPYRVYTEKIPANYGVPLTCLYDGGEIPVLFLLSNDDVYGIEKDVYSARVRELCALLSDGDAEKKRAELGIRSFHGSAVHARLAKGETCLVRVKGTGGIALHRPSF